MAGTYRDEHQAALQRLEALERENARLRKELEERDAEPESVRQERRELVAYEKEARVRNRAAAAWGAVIAAFTVAYYLFGGQ